jgi:Zn-finger nucleic acid-binding protein
MLLCPLCARQLSAVERQGVEIDHCQHCGGFWLDQGELDRLIQQEALTALLQGQRALAETRHEREYDHSARAESGSGAAEDFIGQYGGTAPSSPARFGMARNGAASAVPPLPRAR